VRPELHAVAAQPGKSFSWRGPETDLVLNARAVPNQATEELSEVRTTMMSLFEKLDLRDKPELLPSPKLLDAILIC
jgi:hypothetical protein